MNILALDTATEACSVAIQYKTEQSHIFSVSPQQHSQLIIDRVDELLTAANTDIQNMGLLAFARGPGSFTGVRIATGVIQGFAMATGKPVVAISTLAIMAQQAFMTEQQERVIAAIDARMGEVYFAIFEVDHYGIMQLVGDEAVLPPEIARQQIDEYIAEHGSAFIVGTGWQAYAEQLLLPDERDLLNAASIDILYPNALYMLPLAKAAAQAKQTVPADRIEPVYLRDKVTWKKLPGRE